MKYRKLRIAWSVIWGIAFALLIVLWVRSTHHFDSIGSAKSAISAQGRLYLLPKVNLLPAAGGDATVESYEHLHGAVQTMVARNVKVTPAPGSGPVIPFWALIIVTCLTAITPWLSFRRYSLRTLLIAMTLIAVVLGLIVWAVKS